MPPILEWILSESPDAVLIITQHDALTLGLTFFLLIGLTLSVTSRWSRRRREREIARRNAEEYQHLRMRRM